MCSKRMFLFHVLSSVCVRLQYATGMAAASQTIIIRTALSYQDVYEVRYTKALLLQYFINPAVWHVLQVLYSSFKCSTVSVILPP